MSNVVIVDGYSGGEHIAPELSKKGVNLYHIQSDTPVWDIINKKFNYSQYLKNYLVNDNNFENIIKDLKELDIDYVTAGTETGVELSDRISTELKINSNGIKLSRARRDKYLMLKACEEAGLDLPKFRKITKVTEAIHFFLQNKKKKIVLKPLNSAGTDGVYFCSGHDEIIKAFNLLIGSKNKLGLNNKEILVSEFMEGTEYFINTISSDARVRVTDIWRYKKRSINAHHAVYDYNELCSFNGDKERTLVDYAKKVLVALGVHWGPSHIEIMLTKAGPRLVEIGSRLDGLTVPEVNRKAIGFSPVDLLHESYKGTYYREEGYKLKEYALTVYLTSFERGVLRSIKGISSIRNLNTFFQSNLRFKPGDLIEKTTNYFNAPGFVTLISKDYNNLMRDYKYIRWLEKNNELLELE